MRHIRIMVLAVAVAASGCATTTQNGEARVGVDLLSIPSYQVRAWVPRAPVVRQVCAAADYYAYAWQNTPWQTLTAHVGILLAGEKLEWWDVIPKLFDADEPEKPAVAPLPGATVRVGVDGDGNSIVYSYIPGVTAPVVDVNLTGDGNNVTVAPVEEEE